MELKTFEEIAENFYAPEGTHEYEELNITDSYSRNRGVIKAYKVNGVRMEIKPINNHIFKYGLLSIKLVNRKRDIQTIGVSDNPNYLVQLLYNKYIIK